MVLNDIKLLFTLFCVLNLIYIGKPYFKEAQQKQPFVYLIMKKTIIRLSNNNK